jgi:KDO2-lipid IV(A) lauroyltransferase
MKETGNKLVYALLFMWIKVHAILPLPVLYLLSDIFFFLTYYIIRYRRRTVRINLKNSFPDLTEKELIGLERRFYRHFSDYIVETIKLAHISQEELLKRANIKNPEVVYDLMNQGHTTFMMLLGHYGNWEWFSGVSARFEGRAKIYEVYRPLSNKAFDRLFFYLRTRFGSLGIKKKEAVRDVFNLQRNKTAALVVFVADQTPSKANLNYWTNFLNQDSAIHTGPERIAKKLDVPVIFADMQKTGRGYYTVDFILLADHAKDTPDFWITEQYVRMMDTCILRDPAYWLWTHNRWKHKRTRGE